MDVSGGVMTEERRLGQVLAAARKRAGLTQQGLCHESGVSYSTLAKIERGAIRTPSVFIVKQLADSIGIGLDDLLRGVVVGKAIAHSRRNKKVSRNGVRFVYFDMNGCLVQSAVSRTAQLLAQDSGVTSDVIESIFWQYNNDVGRGAKSIDELNTVLAERVNMLVDWNRYYLAAVKPTPGIADLVEWVAENYHIGILTNTLPNLVRPMLANGTLPQVDYDVIIDSSEVHALKPDPEMFQIAAERAGFSPREILLVDDDPLNLSAAGKLGWQTISFHAYNAADSIVAVSTALQPAD